LNLIKERSYDPQESVVPRIVENHRIASDKTVQRTVLYLGEINDQQQAAWRKTLSVFDEQEQEYANLSLFPGDREIPADAVGSLQVKLSGLELRCPRLFGNCWLACALWQQLGLHEFWDTRLAGSREDVPWEKVLQLLVVSQLLDPTSEFRVHRQWYLTTAMDALLGTNFAVAEKDRLYRCLDRVLEHKQELFLWLCQKWADLFHAEFEVLLYDLTSTYFEGAMEENPKAKYGHSSDRRTDCLQLVIALVITTDGFPLAYEVMDGNTSGRTTLHDFLDKIEKTYGKAKRMWVMDRGIPTEEILQEMRDPARGISYLVGTAKGKIQQYEKKWLDLPWQQVRDSVDVKLFEQDGELYVLAKSEGRRAKETAMRRKRLARLLKKLRAMRRSLPSLVQLLMRLGAAKAAAGRAFHFVQMQVPKEGQEVTRETFPFRVDKKKLQHGGMARRTLLAALQPYRRRSQCVVDALRAVDPDRSGIPIAEKRTLHPPHPPSTGASRRRAHSDCLSRLLLGSDAEAASVAARTRVNAYGGVGEVGGNQNDRCVDSHGRSTMFDSAALHPAFSRHQSADREAEIAVAPPAATAPGGAKTELRNRGNNRTVGDDLVVETFP
jgi:hypothetical protein